jgi:two-component system cell cycle response regulator
MKILVADDDAVSCQLLERLLNKWGYEVIATHNGTEAWEALQAENAPRVALLDWMMPGMDGLEVCRRVRARSSQPYVYIMLLTANDKVGNLVEGLESGADDYLTKPFHPQELNARVRVGLRMLELETSLVEAQESLQFKASHDSLTSIWNRGSIIELLERELSRARREGSSVGILLADIDHFKDINDTWGHLVGDEVLRAVTGRLKSEVRSYDSVGRYGGEEFLLLLAGCDRAKLAGKAEQLRSVVARTPIETTAGPVPVTISIGGIATEECPYCELNTLFRATDAALYRAKLAGRNRTEMASAADIDLPTHLHRAGADQTDTLQSPISSK